MGATSTVDNSVLAADQAWSAVVDADPACLDRDELAELSGYARKVRGFLDALDVRIARRGRQLAAQGGADTFGLFLGGGGRGSQQAHNNERREELCAELPGLEDALSAGDVSSEHLDRLARLTKNLTDDERADLRDRAGELLDHAKGEYVERFEKNAKNIIEQIRSEHRPDADLDELNRQRRDSNVSTWVDKTSGMHKTLIELDPVRNDDWKRNYDAWITHLKQQPSAKDQTWQQLKVDAFLRAVQGPPAPGVPERAATVRVPKVIVLIDLQTLMSGRHPGTIAETSNGTPVPVAVIRQMLCDADIVPAVLGGHGEVLDLGRTRRLASPAQRDALRAMYSTCAKPECDVPFDDCKIHHPHMWDHGGLTDLGNLAPVCDRCHTDIHEHGWHLSVDKHQTMTWTRPDGTTHYHGPAPNRSGP
ncbi:MAG TPA: DUF222 domain-containing protein [Ilumatobacter sp.]|nr:DUF222 domain-containing protein [Ilumatobacter sp.]